MAQSVIGIRVPLPWHDLPDAIGFLEEDVPFSLHENPIAHTLIYPDIESEIIRSISPPLTPIPEYRPSDVDIQENDEPWGCFPGNHPWQSLQFVSQ